MVLPAILSGFILAVLQALALFGSPAILALPAGFHTVTTQIWSFFQYPPSAEMAAAFSIPLLLATALLLLVAEEAARAARLRGGGRQGRAAADRSRSGAGAIRRSRAAWPCWPARCSCPTASCQGRLRPRLGPAAHVRRTSRSRTGRSPSCTARPRSAIVNTLELGVLTACVGAGLATLLAYVTNRRLVDGPPGAGLSRARPGGHPGRGAGGGALRRLHAAAVPALRHAVDPLHRLSDQGDAGRLLAVRRHLPGHPPRAGGGGPHPGRGAAARAARDHRAARPQRHHRHLVLRLHRGHPRAVGLHHPVHARTPRSCRW